MTRSERISNYVQTSEFSLFACWGSVLRCPEIWFAIFILPTSFARLSTYLAMPEYLSIKSFLFVYLLLFVMILTVKRKTVPHIPAGLLVAYAAFLLLMVWSLTWTQDYEYGLLKSTEFLSLTTLSCFAPLFLFREGKAFDRFVMTLVVISILLCAYILASMPYSLFHTEAGQVKFETSLGSDYVFLQHLMGMGALGIIYHLLYKESKTWKKVFFIALSVLFVGTLLYSAGKSSVIAFFLTVLFMMAVSVKRKRTVFSFKKKYFKLGVFMMVVGTVAMLSVGWVFLERTKALAKPDYYGRVERLANAKIALDLFLEKPFRGAGIGAFAVYSKSMEGVERFKYPHNIILEVMSEMGSVGLILFFVITGAAFRKLIHLKNRYWHSRLYSLPSVVLSLLIFTSMTALTSGNVTNLALFAWVGCAYAVENIAAKETADGVV